MLRCQWQDHLCQAVRTPARLFKFSFKICRWQAQACTPQSITAPKNILRLPLVAIQLIISKPIDLIPAPRKVLQPLGAASHLPTERHVARPPKPQCCTACSAQCSSTAADADAKVVAEGPKHPRRILSGQCVLVARRSSRMKSTTSSRDGWARSSARQQWVSVVLATPRG